MNGHFQLPAVKNEPLLDYTPGSPARESLKAELKRQSAITLDIPVIIGGKDISTGKLKEVVMPHNHKHVLARVHQAGEKELKLAIDTALEAKKSWATMPHSHRQGIFLKAAELLSGPWRDIINAATMLGQSKTVYQAEIDSACELCDFFRFNVAYSNEIYKIQPDSVKGTWNRMEYRPLDGFVLAVTPFNFTSIAANLPFAPALMGNTVVWKPAGRAALSGYYIYLLLCEAGLPPGVINFVPSSGRDVGAHVVRDPRLGGVHFTGSTATFNEIWREVGCNISNYEQYPRLVGETGGKDFVFAHNSADVGALIAALVRGAFEYQGQKCSAASRAYIPRSIWPKVKTLLLREIEELKIGDPADFTTFMSAVIDRESFDRIKGYIDRAKESKEADVLCGGYDDSKGYFIYPTVIEAKDPHYESMCEEIFGPVLTVYVYEDDRFEETLDLCDSSSPYALTGAVFAKNRKVLVAMESRLRHAAGNFYLNDKPTGAVVGQQPFGGSRASGTNDKAGSLLNMIRWTSPRVIKETFVPIYDIAYPYMVED
ncbi:MAG TPA: L-glutamate gamma-semialdehyde dehydrogenase [Clostridiaceae bacterium]|nr:L-glutamate gamma-semialdehyde dehydrogenase [Clostridiaceae bacterium]